MALNPNKLPIPLGTDLSRPRAWIVNLALALASHTITPVLNAADRAQVIADLGAGNAPDSDNPIYVHRADADAGNELEVTINGTDWSTVAPADRTRNMVSTPVGDLSVGSSVTLVPDQTIPGRPFGLRPWQLTVAASVRLGVPGGGIAYLRFLVNNVQVKEFAITSPGTVHLAGSHTLNRDAATTGDITVRVQLISGAGTLTVIEGGPVDFTAKRRVAL